MSTRPRKTDNSTPGMWMPRLTQAEFTWVAKVMPGELVDAKGKSVQSKLVRPKKHLADDLTSTYLRKDERQCEMHILH